MLLSPGCGKSLGLARAGFWVTAVEFDPPPPPPQDASARPATRAAALAARPILIRRKRRERKRTDTPLSVKGGISCPPHGLAPRCTDHRRIERNRPCHRARARRGRLPDHDLGPPARQARGS